MSLRHIIHPSFLTAVLLAAGCTTDFSQSANERPALKHASSVTQEQARHLAFTYRRQANDLRELARRTEMEALLYSGQFGPNHEESSRRLVQAKDLLAAAQEADELARAYQRQVPHGQMQ